MPAFLRGALYSAGFLTILPLRVKGELKDHSLMAASFPLVGLLIGMVLSLCGMALSDLSAPALTAVVIVAVWVALTGGLHMDGLADTADGLASGFDRKKILKVMDDHASGTFAILAVIFAILIKIAVLVELEGNLPLILLVAPVYARWSMVLVLFLSNYPDKDGLAKPFFDETGGFTLLISTSILFIVSLSALPYSTALVMLMSALSVTMVAAKYFEYRIGGNTGDTLGAILEINEISMLFIFFLIIN